MSDLFAKKKYSEFHYEPNAIYDWALKHNSIQINKLPQARSSGFESEFFKTNNWTGRSLIIQYDESIWTFTYLSMLKIEEPTRKGLNENGKYKVKNIESMIG